jgi:MFS family permease
MRLPTALAPLRLKLFRLLWSANVVVSLGVWLQNTGAGWLMTTLAPSPLMVSMVQAATILPVFLLALPAGAIADILDKRLFILGTQVWMALAAAALAIATFLGHTDATMLLAFTFAIGAGAAMNSPAWGSVLIEVVPRRDIAQAVALNGVGFNLARAVGPALAGFLVLFGGPGLAFGLNALTYFAVIAALLIWHKRKRPEALPRERLGGAIRAGIRFVSHAPAMRAAMLRCIAFFFPAAAPWALLPLVVKQELGLGAGIYGILLGLMGAGGVAAGMMLPRVRRALSRGQVVMWSTVFAAAGTAGLGLARHWAFAALAMLVFGIGWVAAASVIQSVAQLAAAGWVRSRALAIYQLALNGALVIGTFFWGWLGDEIGLRGALLAAAGACAVLAVVVRTVGIDDEQARPTAPTPAPAPEAVDPALATVLGASRDRVLETQAYRIAPGDRAAFLELMAEIRHVRGRLGAVAWRLYEDVSHQDAWLEVWQAESWTDHLREVARLSEADRATLAQALALSQGQRPLRRYIAVKLGAAKLGAARLGAVKLGKPPPG